jgi:hypothetical protein
MTGYDCVNHHGLHNGAESPIVIDVRTLREPVKNLAGLVSLECPISLEFVLEYPVVGDNIDAAVAQNQVPSAVGHEGGVLFLHSRPLMRIGEGGLN